MIENSINFTKSISRAKIPRKPINTGLKDPRVSLDPSLLAYPPFLHMDSHS